MASCVTILKIHSQTRWLHRVFQRAPDVQSANGVGFSQLQSAPSVQRFLFAHAPPLAHLCQSTQYCQMVVIAALIGINFLSILNQLGPISRCVFFCIRGRRVKSKQVFRNDSKVRLRHSTDQVC